MIAEGSDAFAESKFFGTPLQAAAGGGHMDNVLLLLEHAVHVSASLIPVEYKPRHPCAYENIIVALRAASPAGHEDIVRLLSDSKYNPEGSDEGSQFGVCDAARIGHKSVTKFVGEVCKGAMCFVNKY